MGSSLKRNDYRRFRLNKGDRLKYGLIGGAGSVFIAYTFYRLQLLMLIAFPAGAVCYPLLKRKDLQKKRLRTLNLQFKESIEILSNYIRSGYSVENAFISTHAELRRSFGEKADICIEYALLCKGIGMNIPPEQLLTDFAVRSGMPDIINFSEVFGIAKRNGGNMSQIIERTAAVIREKAAVSEEIHTMTAAARYEQGIMNFIPFLIIFYIDFSSPGFMSVMYQTAAGRLLMSAALCLLSLSIFLSGRILDIHV